MKNIIFIPFCLMLVLTYVSIYHITNYKLSDLDYYKQKYKLESHINQSQKLQIELSEYKLYEFQQQVAEVLPPFIKRSKNVEESYPLRNLASIVQKPNWNKISSYKSKSIFNKAKKYFQSGQYNLAIRFFKVLINEYSYSVYSLEAYFLMSESYFQLRNLEESITAIDTMVTLFPGSELTGFAMLRLGKIFEIQNRSEEASGIYKTVLQSFSERDLVNQAKTALRSMAL